ncbi:hypothetical protein HNY73_022748 [Argiope bruennichi]|uniref:Uncharacterized protein n=1 Tax=Argiope bruennichi TaxID=94029 RepID=A0A8T0E3D7_ARGBR|nr:hypothetical protein HNY73_022748 [Argiope bruennichi]
MKIKVILLLIGTAVIDAGLLNTAFYPKSLYGGFSYTSPYDAIRNYHRERYYAKKSYDLARLRAGIYGLGFGFYGFRYGGLYPGVVKPAFLGYSAPVSPVVGFDYPKPYQKTYIPPVVFPVGNAYVPKIYGGAYTQSYAFGKGYSYSKNTFDGGPYLQYPKVILPAPNFVNPPVPLSKVTPILLGPGFSPYTPGYQYSYFIKDPVVSKGIAWPLTGYDSIYGTRYNKFPPLLPTIGSKIPTVWKGSSVAPVPPIWKGSAITPPVWKGPAVASALPDWKGSAVAPALPDWKGSAVAPALPDWKGSSLAPSVWKGSAVAPVLPVLKGSPIDVGTPTWKGFPAGSVPISKDPFKFNPNYGVRFDDYQNQQLISNSKESPWNNIAPSSPILGNTGYSLLPPTGPDFLLDPPVYNTFSDPSYDYSARSDSNSFGYNEPVIKSSGVQDLVAYGSSPLNNEKTGKISNSTVEEKENKASN